MTVVDASVASKWFLFEQYSEEAIALTQMDHKLIAPTLAHYEVAGSIIRARREERISDDEATLQLGRWLKANSTNVVRLEQDDRDMIRGAQLAFELGHPLKDCLYLAMAERHDCPLVTADRQFYDRAREPYDRVMFVTEVERLAA